MRRLVLAWLLTAGVDARPNRATALVDEGRRLLTQPAPLVKQLI